MSDELNDMRDNRQARSPYFMSASLVTGVLLYIVGSFLCALGYDPGLEQLLLAGLFMVSGIFVLDYSLLLQNASGWKKWIQRLNYLATLLFISGFIAIGSYGFQPGLVQLPLIYGGYLSLFLYALSFLLTIVRKWRKYN